MHMALETRRWTRADLDRLPDDGNRYEVLDGELLVTPTPSDVHEEIVSWLHVQLAPFVVEHSLGRIYRPHAVMVIDGSQGEPDLMVRPTAPLRGWENAPIPILVVEVLSQTTRQRDPDIKRAFYLKAGVQEYWVVDRYSRSVRRFTADTTDTITSVLPWAPRGSAATLGIDVGTMFRETYQATATPGSGERGA